MKNIVAVLLVFLLPGIAALRPDRGMDGEIYITMADMAGGWVEESFSST